MKIERTKNASKNMVFGFLNRIQQTVLPFLMRTIMIVYMGEQYLGLNSLFTSILHILNLAELGVGHAMIYSMYKPIADDDESTICALMGLYRKYYRIIGLVIATVGLALTPAIPYLIKGSIPSELNIYVLYLLNLGVTVLTYWLFAYKNSLMQAHQRMDVISKITMITNVSQCVLQVVVLVVFRNYYLYMVIALLTQIATNIGTAIVANRMYPKYKPRGKLSVEKTKSINKKIRDLFTSKMGGAIIGPGDTVVISAFLGLSVLAIYQNYYFIMTAVIGIVEMILQSIMAGVGNSLVTETNKKNYDDFKKFTFLYLWMIGIGCCCFLSMYQPFIELWVGAERKLEDGMVICFASYFLIYTAYRLMNLYKDAAGLWHHDRWRPLITGICNVGLNLIWVQWWGVYGVILSTIVSILVVGMPWLLHNLFHSIFEKEKMWEYIGLVACFAALTVVSGGVTWWLCGFVTGNLWLVIIVRAAISVVVSNIVFLIALHRAKQFGPAVQMVDALTKNKLKLGKLFLRRG